MCVVSMVHDHYSPLIPDPNRTDGNWPWRPAAPTFTPFPAPTVESIGLAAQILELRKLIADFREAVAAAKKVDDLTGQPDCVDPEKQKLEDRVKALEAKLDAMSKPKRARTRK